MFWKAVSTLEASKAEVSIKDRLFSSVNIESKNENSVFQCRISPRTCEMFCLFRRHCSQMSQITLVSDQHDDDVCIGVISQFLEPSSHVCERLLLGNVVYKECSDGTSVVAVVQGLSAKGMFNARGLLR
jgi:hypothetical protein